MAQCFSAAKESKKLEFAPLRRNSLGSSLALRGTWATRPTLCHSERSEESMHLGGPALQRCERVKTIRVRAVAAQLPR